MSKGYSSEGAAERIQRAREAQQREAEQEAQTQDALRRAKPHRGMSETLIVIDRSAVRPGKLSDVEAAIRALVAFVEANEPRPLAYRAYVTDDGAQMTVVQVHPDSASMEVHMELAGPAFRGFAELVKLSEMHVYGTPSEALLAMLQRKVKMLGNGTLTVHGPHAGFERFVPR